MKLSESDLAKIKREQCAICDIDLAQCHENAIAFQSATGELHLRLVASPIGRRMIATKRLVVFHSDGHRTAGIVLRESVSRGLTPAIEILSLHRLNPIREASDLLPYVPRFRRFFAALPTKVTDMNMRVVKVPLNDIEIFTRTTVKVGAPRLRAGKTLIMLIG